MRSPIPESHRDLLERPLFVHPATIRPDGGPQVNPLWCSWDGTRLRFTGIRTRFKFRDVTADPRVAACVNDPDEPYRHPEIRGVVERVDDDSSGAFFAELAERYRRELDGRLPPDVEDRAVYVVRPTAVSHQRAARTGPRRSCAPRPRPGRTGRARGPVPRP
ncbi:PPOX class F420-dependent oxidoreductase [Streptomyces echinoruber]|uniref:PPOX class F420-dependent enzyme n=1 Tax=Streptomyces echinoruber TaxID=68898 RepID=A0A918RFZ8_9ACTN|nr:PPOX class F420-dependent oxidoreductase [Streptomyces echinoruber]GGZ97504.1 PPOX class F420-dependent enzyme [Streptomyces echinoruber]